jgi:hypothetical protein
MCFRFRILCSRKDKIIIEISFKFMFCEEIVNSIFCKNNYSPLIPTSSFDLFSFTLILQKRTIHREINSNNAFFHLFDCKGFQIEININ